MFLRFDSCPQQLTTRQKGVCALSEWSFGLVRVKRMEGTALLRPRRGMNARGQEVRALLRKEWLGRCSGDCKVGQVGCVECE